MSGPVLHSKIGASGMDRWENCPGSVALAALAPVPEQNVHAALGSYAHSLSERCLGAEYPLKELALLALTEDPNLIDAISVYVNLIVEERKTADIAWIEKSFDMSETVHRNCFGTADAVHYYRKERLLRIYDYKHGVGKAVKPEGNRQLLYYALGAFLELEHPVDLVELVVVQPRAPRKGEVIHRWALPSKDLWDFAFELIIAAKRTEDPNAALQLGPWCWFCPAVSICPLKLEEREEKARADFTVIE
jgi:hypothetical protein